MKILIKYINKSDIILIGDIIENKKEIKKDN